MFWPSIVWPYSSSADSGKVAELGAKRRIGESAGLTFWNVGGVVIDVGNWRVALAIADCTSCAAASMSRSSANCNVIWVEPS